MITKKIIFLQKKKILYKKHIELDFEVPNIHEVKDYVNVKFRKYSYFTLVFLVKSYIISSKLIRKNSIKLYKKLKNKLFKNKKYKIESIIKNEYFKIKNFILNYKNKIVSIKKRLKEKEEKKKKIEN